MVMTLAASPRTETGKKLKDLRDAGMLPGVVYGPKKEATNFTISRKEFEKVFAASGESTLISLTGLGEPNDVLVHAVDTDPVTGHPIHVDLYAVEANKLLQVHVELEFVGDAPVLKAGSAVLTKVLHEVEVECLPRDLPAHITVDVSGLSEVGATIHVKDLPVLPGVQYLADADDVVVVASEVVEEVEEAPAAVDMSAIEVEKKGKQEEEEAPQE